MKKYWRDHDFGCREDVRFFFFFFLGPLPLPLPLAEVPLWSVELLDLVAAALSATALRLHR